MEVKKIQLDAANLFFETQTSILTVEYKSKRTITLQDAQQIIKAAKSITGEKKYASLSILEDNPISKEAQKILLSSSKDLVAIALIVKNELLKNILQMFIEVNPPKCEYKFFTAPEDAKQWLTKILNAR